MYDRLQPDDCMFSGDHRASRLHRWRRAVSSDAERPVLSYGREESVLTRHHSSDPRRTLQQPRDDPDVPVTQPHHRATSSHRLPVLRLRHEAELRLVEEVKVTAERGQGRGSTPTAR